MGAMIEPYLVKKIIDRMCASFFTGARYGKKTVFVVKDSKHSLTGSKWMDFRMKHTYYNIIDISNIFSFAFITACNNPDSVLRCSNEHYDFVHCILTLTSFRIIDDDGDIPCSLLHQHTDPNSLPWCETFDFAKHFDIIVICC